MELMERYMNVSAKVMDLQLDRQNLVTSNLANIETPRYRPRRIEFEKELQQALNQDMRGRLTRTSPEHMPAAFAPGTFDRPVGEEFQPRYVYGEDRVDLDKEMTILNKNQLEYNTLTTVVQHSFQELSKIVTEGSR
ncbi:flagellar basal-body rod protein FlgB [Desulfovibrio sp. X2]|uniref:flagellar basal body rod protein FlgB n=1 Tax=Desulfovibrio sp. X2 TaxID=941449 RepID=UPI000358B3F3|nr:flagellar basal body rod protein FlgB [Desulfovibrio sp. X2]EPR44301.1 flagellar basal-body rod protein FlgB [Desulfovibrio sp. X2]